MSFKNGFDLFKGDLKKMYHTYPGLTFLQEIAIFFSISFILSKWSWGFGFFVAFIIIFFIFKLCWYGIPGPDENTRLSRYGFLILVSLIGFYSGRRILGDDEPFRCTYYNVDE